MGTLPITYRQDGVRAVITLDGVDISKAITRFSVDHGATEVPKVYLEIRDGLDGLPDGIDVEAIVHLREVVLEDPADAMLRFIEPLDPDEFEKACLAAMELGGPATFGAAALAVLRGYAEGKPSS